VYYFNQRKGIVLMKKRYSGPQIVAKLREADRLLGQGKTVEEVCKEINVTDATYYRWRKKYGGMSPDMIKQLRAVQKENAQLKRLVADQALDISILKVAAEGNF
jgi:putative transposase